MTLLSPGMARDEAIIAQQERIQNEVTEVNRCVARLYSIQSSGVVKTGEKKITQNRNRQKV